MTLLRSLLLSFPLLAACLLFAPDARAATECSASMTGVDFGTVNASGNTDAMATLTVSCTTSGGPIIGTTRVRMCLNIGEGMQGGGLGIVPRRMTNGSGDALQFQLYKNAAPTDVWGSRFFPPTTPLQVDLQYGLLLGSGSGSVTPSPTLHGRIPLQAGLAAGSYQNQFAGIHTSFEFHYTETLLGGSFPPSCTMGGTAGSGGTLPFTVTANVPNRCDISTATDLAFGAVPGLIGSPQDQTSSISMTCTRRTAWNVALDNGQNAVGNTRRMRLGATGQYVAYELYRNAGRTDRWGSTIGTDTQSGTATDPTQNLTVHGRVPAPQSVPAGNYSDVVTVTVTY